jgi:mitogen-activated protein kinase kinase kinase kinase 4
MSEQYAFAIGFDVESMQDQTMEGSDLDWTHQTRPKWEEVAAAITAAGLPPIESERWDEFGLGRIFWGTKAECDAIHQVLSQFDLYIEEARNLDTGYYATANATYYVDDNGNIYSLPTDGQILNPSTIESTLSIPLDAYRLKAVDPSLDAQMQSFLRAGTPPPTRPMIGVPEIAPVVSSDLSDVVATQELPEDYATLQAQFKQQSDHIQVLEQQVIAFEDQVAALQAASAAKVDPEAHAALQQEHTALQAELTQTVEQMQALQAQVQELSAASKVEDPNAMRQSELLHEELAQQTTRIADLEAQLAQANAQTTDWQQQLERAIDPDVHQQLQQQLQEQLHQNQSLQGVIQQLEEQVHQASATIPQAAEALQQRDEALQQRDEALQQRDEALQQRDEALQQRDEALQQRDEALQQRDEAIQQQSALQQELTDKTSRVADFQKTVHQLEHDLNEWQTVAEAKVDWAEYQAVQSELQLLKAKQKRGLFSRLFGWLFH